jgi:WD40 repeat protein
VHRQRSPTQRVFVSYTSELAEYPPGQSFVEAACAGVRRVDAVPVTMLDFGARQGVPPEVCRDEVLSCDIHLSVIGFRYGSPIPERPDGISYTEFEFDVATEAGLPRLVFFVDEQSPLPPALIDEDRGRVNRFRRRVREGTGHIVSAMVGDPGRLEAAVSQALVRLLRQGPRSAPGTPADDNPLWMLPALNAPIVDRPELAEALLGALTAPGLEPSDVTTAIEGPGGFGKSTLVGMVCRRPEVRSRFPGGLLWVTVGERAGGAGLAATIGELCALLSGESPATADPMLAGGRLGELLDAGEPKLLVLDDVWRSEQLAPFLIGGVSCRRLVTTRNAGVVPRGGPLVVVAQMTADEARQALTAGLGGLSAGTVSGLLAATGRWPVLVGLVNAALKDKVLLGATAEQSAEWALGRLEALGPTAFDADDAGGPSRRVAATIEASMDLLTPAERSRYLELAVLPKDVDVPDAAVALLWRATAGMSAADAERLRARLARLRLVNARWSGRSPTVRLHDVLRSYLRRQCSAEQLTDWNRALVDEARGLLPDGRVRRPGPWWLLPADADYLWRMTPRHLAEAGADDELAAVVCDLRWILARIRRTGSPAASEADLGLIETPRARVLGRALSQASHLLTPLEPPDALGATLASRLDGDPELATVVAELRATMARPQLVPDWPLPDLPQRALLRTLSGHEGAVYGCAFSPDGTLLASVGGDGTVRLCEVASGRSTVLRGHGDRVYGCAFSTDGTLLATVGEDRTVRLWDPVTASAVAVLGGHTDSVHTCVFSPDGRQLATTGDDHTARVWDVRSRAPRSVLTCQDDYVASCAFIDGIIVLASVGDGPEVRICDPSTGAVRAMSTGHTDRVHSCAFSVDGTLLASASTDTTLRVSDVATATMRQVMRGHTDQVLDCAFAPDGRLLVSASEDHTARLWDISTGRSRAILAGHTDRVHGCAFSSDSALVASASGDGTVGLWDVAAAGGEGDLAGHTDRVNRCAFSPDGALLASASWDRTARLWSVSDGTVHRVLAGHSDRVSDCSFSPDGRTLATAGWDGRVSLWEAASGARLAALRGHEGRVYACAFSGTGDLLASAGADGVVRLWNVVTGVIQQLLVGHVGPAHACVFAPGDATVASAGVDGVVRLWDVATGEAHAALAGHTGWILDCAFSPDGTLLASAGVDATIRLWDLTTGLSRVLIGHDGWVHGCSFSPDGALLASAGLDGSVRIWDRRTGRCRCALRLADRLMGCAWHPRSDRVSAVGVRGVYLLRCDA